MNVSLDKLNFDDEENLKKKEISNCVKSLRGMKEGGRFIMCLC